MEIYDSQQPLAKLPEPKAKPVDQTAKLEKQFMQDLTLDILRMEQTPANTTMIASMKLRLAISLMRLYKMNGHDLGDHYNYTHMVEMAPDGKLGTTISLKLPNEKPTKKLVFKLSAEGFDVTTKDGVTELYRAKPEETSTGG